MTVGSELHDLSPHGFEQFTALRPSGLEIASGATPGRAPVGARPPFLALPETPALSPLAALERAILPALQRSPCVVSFSGSAASSFVLAVAARLARRVGLPPPVPITWRFTGAPDEVQSTWQTRVIAALPIADWPVLREDDTLDPVGPVAQRLLIRYGVLHPRDPDVALHLPLIEQARGGSLVTGSGGTRVLTGWGRPSARPPSVTDRLSSRVTPLSWQRRGAQLLPWLHPEVSRRVSGRQERDLGSEPRRIDQRIDWRARSRELLMARSALAAAAAVGDVLLVDPYLDELFCTALRFLARRSRGPAGRELLLAVAAGSVPDIATECRPESPIPGPFLREPTRNFVRNWDGTGADGSFVNVGQLRRLWSSGPVPVGTTGLVQQLWLASHNGVPSDQRIRRS